MNTKIADSNKHILLAIIFIIISIIYIFIGFILLAGIEIMKPAPKFGSNIGLFNLFSPIIYALILLIIKKIFNYIKSDLFFNNLFKIKFHLYFIIFSLIFQIILSIIPFLIGDSDYFILNLTVLPFLFELIIIPLYILFISSCFYIHNRHKSLRINKSN